MSRHYAIPILENVIVQKKSLNHLQKNFNVIPEKDRALIKELCFGVIRWYYQLSFIADKFLSKPLKQKDTDIYILLLLGIYQILFTRIPDHAAISETVEGARKLKKEWATKLINAVLRNFLREKENTLENLIKHPQAYYSHPNWMINKIKASWPDAEKIFTANNAYPPLCLRVNVSKISRTEYSEFLAAQNYPFEILPETQTGLILTKPIEPTKLPGFSDGLISVQDGAAQLAAELLDPKPSERILDACAAPGGKTCHILEKQPHLSELIAIDNSIDRIDKISENLRRLNLSAKVICHDVEDLSWWDGNLFDRILLDVPCSSTGVIQRHPDIKLLRQPEDIENLAVKQKQLLEAIWQILKPTGTLLYVTCSIFKEENDEIISSFITAHDDCQEQKINASWGMPMSAGRQVLPGMHRGMDGFYFAKLVKT